MMSHSSSDDSIIIIDIFIPLFCQDYSSSEGDLHVSLSWSPLSYKLEGIIHKATGLRKYDIMFGLSGMN